MDKAVSLNSTLPHSVHGRNCSDMKFLSAWLQSHLDRKQRQEVSQIIKTYDCSAMRWHWMHWPMNALRTIYVSTLKKLPPYYQTFKE